MAASTPDRRGTVLLERFQVSEIFAGLPQNTTEVWVEPGSATNCGIHHTLGASQLIVGNQTRSARAAHIFEFIREQDAALLPAGFDGSTAIMVSTNMCSPGGDISSPAVAADLDYLRRQKSGDWTLLVTGHLSQMDDFFSPVELPDARIVLSTGDTALETTTNERGLFTIPVPAPGDYSAQILKPGYRSKAPIPLIKVPPGGCGYLSMEMLAQTRLEVRLRDASGKPVSGKRISLMLHYASGWSPLNRPFYTDQEGLAVMEDIPAATYLIALNPIRPDGRPNGSPTIYYPDVPEERLAKPVAVEPGSHLSFTLTLP